MEAALNTFSKIRLWAFIAVIPLAVLAIFSVSDSRAMHLIAHGPIQTGHADVSCQSCHVPSAGTLRQQVQAKAKFAIGMRQSNVDFGYATVASSTCLDCHERPNERHPIYRFQEPRFIEATAQIEATSCLGCHTEHTGDRVEVSAVFCVHCHADLEVKNDPIDVAHTELIAAKDWGSCMGCHDFHGNHTAKAPLQLKKAAGMDAIKAYFADGPSPYGEKKLYEAEAD